MPSAEVLKKFRKGKLHSGHKRGKVVTNPAQARAIQISEAREEGHDIPERKGKRKSKRARGRKKVKRGRGRR